MARQRVFKEMSHGEQVKKANPMTRQRFDLLARKPYGMFEVAALCRVLTEEQIRVVKQTCLDSLQSGVDRPHELCRNISTQAEKYHERALRGIFSLAKEGLLGASDREILWAKGTGLDGRIDGWLIRVYGCIKGEGPGEVLKIMQAWSDDRDLGLVKFEVARELLKRKKLAEEWDPNILLEWFLERVPRGSVWRPPGLSEIIAMLEEMPKETLRRVSKPSLANLLSWPSKEVRMAVIKALGNLGA